MPATTTAAPAAPAAAPAPAAPAAAPKSFSDSLNAFAAAGLPASDGIPGARKEAKKAAATAPAEAQTGPETAAKGPEEAAAATENNSRAAKLAKLKDRKRAEALIAMSNDSFNYWLPIAEQLENGDLIPKNDHERLLSEREQALQAQIKANNFLDHEEGYKLTPEWNKVDSQLRELGNVKNFWTQQLAAFEAGKPFRWLETDKDGQLVVGGKSYNPDDHPEARGEMISQITQATSMALGLQQQAEAMPKAHKEQYTRLQSRLVDIDKQMFGGVNNEKFPKLAAAHLEQFPAIVRGRPEYKFLANALAAGEIMLERINALQEQLGRQTNAAAAADKGAPAPGQQGGGAPAATNTKAALRKLNSMLR